MIVITLLMLLQPLVIQASSITSKNERIYFKHGTYEQLDKIERDTVGSPRNG